MNRHDERRPRFWRHGRDRDRDRDRDESFRDRDYGFEARGDSGRTAGDRDQQPYSGNPYGYYPGQQGPDRSGREWSGRWSGRDAPSERDRWGSDRSGRGSESGSGERWSEQRYGQREPYNARGGSERSRYGGPSNSDDSSRYSESQYGTRRAQFDPYGEQAEPEFGEGPFADTSQSPGYFGSGNYGDGGASSTGGYDQRWRSRNPGSLGEDTFTREYAAREMRGRYRTGPKGYTRSDDRIREDICERLMLADSIDSSEASVSVKDGKVTLEGTVPTRSMKHAIEDVADHTAGVQDVDNRIRVGVQTGAGVTPTSGGSSKTTKQ